MWTEEDSRRGLDTLDLAVRLDGLLVRVDWFRMLHRDSIPNPQWHQHRDLELHCVAEGAVELLFADRRLTAGKNAAVLIPPGIAHRLRGNGAPCRRFVLKLSIEADEDCAEAAYVRDSLAVSHTVALDLPPQSLALLEESLAEAATRGPGFLSIIGCNVIRLLVEIARALAPLPRAKYRIAEKTGSALQRMDQIQALIEEGCAGPLRVEQVADRLFLSPRQIQRIVKSQTGKSLRQLQMEARHARARQLLRDPAQRIADIAAALGFASEQSFARFFRQMEGQPPAQYRKGILSE